MATYDQIHTAANHSGVLNRVRVAIVDVAIAVQQENPTTLYHRERGDFARSVLMDPDTWVRRLVYGVALDTTVQVVGANATDAQIKTAVAAMWNAYAVVTMPPATGSTV